MTTNDVSIKIDSPTIDTKAIEKLIRDRIVNIIAQEKRPGGLLNAGQDVVITKDIIDSDVLQEILDERDRKLQEQFHHMLMGAMMQMQKPQQPVRSADDLLKKSLVEAIEEGGSHIENRLIAIIAGHARTNWPKGDDIYQLLNAAYMRLS